MEEIEELEQELQTKSQELTEKQATAAKYEPLVDLYSDAVDEYQNFSKALMPGSNSERVFDFLRVLNTNAAYTELNFDFRDSTRHGQYGIVSSTITGSGNYSYLYNFIRYIEFSRPINKIRNLQISPVNEVEKYSEVNFTFTLNTYYDRSPAIEKTSLDVVRPPSNLSRNPFYPLLREVEPNNDNLTDVESSRLIAVTPRSVYLRNQNGMLVNIQIGERVYLGSLKQVNAERKTATFTLNKGGIIETVILGMEEDEDKEDE